MYESVHTRYMNRAETKNQSYSQFCSSNAKMHVEPLLKVISSDLQFSHCIFLTH